MSIVTKRALTVAWYLALALWCLRVVLPHPASTIGAPADLPPTWRQISLADQKIVVTMVADHERALFHAPGTLLDGPQCYPLRHALMLGQHELGEGLLGVVPYALTGDPMLTYNAVMLLAIALAGIAMHALIHAWTGDTAAAFVAGTLFAVHPSRIGDLVHLSAVGNYWTVASLLFLTRFFARPTWAAAGALGMTAGAQLLESIYPLLPHAIIFSAMSVWLAWRHRHELPRLAPKLALAAALVVAAAVAVLGPYLAFKATWGSLAGREHFLFPLRAFAPGGEAYSGSVATLLATVALADRFRRSHEGFRPQLVLLAAGLLVAWAAVLAVPIPALGVTIPSLFGVLATIVPGLDAVRRGGSVVVGWHLAVVALAGLGVAALLRGRARVVRAGVAAALAALALAEVLVPAVAHRTFGRTFGLVAYGIRPPEAVLALYDRMAPGAVLDVPYELGPGRFYRMADFALATAFHHHRAAACYNSFRVAIQEDVMSYAARVFTDAPAAEALAALGIANVVYHVGVPSRTGMTPPSPVPSHLAELGRAADQILYRITSTPAVTEAADALETRIVPGSGSVQFELAFRNRGTTLFRHPDPIEPTALVVRWYGDGSTLLGEDRVALLLPTALPAGEELRRPLALRVAPPATARRLSIATAGAPDRPLASLDLAR